MPDTPLESVPGWSVEQIACMKQASITSAEQVVAIAATPRGLRSLAEHLNVPVAVALSLVEAARAALSPATRAEMEADGAVDYGLGVLPPREDDE